MARLFLGTNTVYFQLITHKHIRVAQKSLMSCEATVWNKQNKKTVFSRP